MPLSGPLHTDGVGQPTTTCKQQLCADAECSLEDLPVAMDDRNGWRGKEIQGYPC